MPVVVGRVGLCPATEDELYTRATSTHSTTRCADESLQIQLLLHLPRSPQKGKHLRLNDCLFRSFHVSAKNLTNSNQNANSLFVRPSSLFSSSILPFHPRMEKDKISIVTHTFPRD